MSEPDKDSGWQQERSPDPGHLLGRFVDLFRKRDLLEKSLKVNLRDRAYRLYCSEERFCVFRLNPNPGISPGIPGWLICQVTQEAVIDCAGDAIDHGEPGAGEWLNCIAAENFHHI